MIVIEEDLYFAYRKKVQHINGKMYYIITLIEISKEDLTAKYANDSEVEVVRQSTSIVPLN